MASARVAALRILTRRDHTVAELREKLTAAEFDAADVDETIATLQREGLLNDRRVAEAHARTASRIKGRGRLRIERELQARGIDRTLAHEVATGLDEADEIATIRRIVSRKYPSGPTDGPMRRKIFAQLLRRGFRADSIARVLRAPGVDDD